MSHDTTTCQADPADPTDNLRELVITDEERLFIVVQRDATATSESARSKLADAMTPGFQAEFDPVEAEAAGAFQESALSEVDAIDSTHG